MTAINVKKKVIPTPLNNVVLPNPLTIELQTDCDVHLSSVRSS